MTVTGEQGILIISSAELCQQSSMTSPEVQGLNLPRCSKSPRAAPESVIMLLYTCEASSRMNS